MQKCPLEVFCPRVDASMNTVSIKNGEQTKMGTARIPREEGRRRSESNTWQFNQFSLRLSLPAD